MDYKIMFRKRTIKRTRDGVTIYDRMLSATRKTMFRLMFALAMANKITPKQLAKAYDTDKLDEYASKFTQELISKGRKATEKARKLQDKKECKSSKKTCK